LTCLDASYPFPTRFPEPVAVGAVLLLLVVVLLLLLLVELESDINMSLMDISKIFSLLQPREDEEEEAELCEALNQAVSGDDAALLSRLLSQENYRRCINCRSGWGIPVTPLRAAASRGHLRCLEVLEVSKMTRIFVTCVRPALTGGRAGIGTLFSLFVRCLCLLLLLLLCT